MPEQDAGRRTLVTFLLDHSAPMTEIRDTTTTSFNTYLDILKRAGDRIEFTLMLFNSEGLEQLHVCKPINGVPHLTRETYLHVRRRLSSTPHTRPSRQLRKLCSAEPTSRRWSSVFKRRALRIPRPSIPGPISRPSLNERLNCAGNSIFWAVASMPAARALAWRSPLTRY
jgi:hypothetical protein